MQTLIAIAIILGYCVLITRVEWFLPTNGGIWHYTGTEWRKTAIPPEMKRVSIEAAICDPDQWRIAGELDGQPCEWESRDKGETWKRIV